MAGGNLVGAFALGTANQVAATISVDLRTAIADGNNSVLLTLSNTDVKANVIDDLNDIGQLDVDDLSVLLFLVSIMFRQKTSTHLRLSMELYR